MNITTEELKAIRKALLVARNNWFEEMQYGHLDTDKRKLFDTWEKVLLKLKP